MARELTSVKIDQARAEALTIALLNKASEEAARETAAFTRIMDLFNGSGKGATFDTANDTAWGWLNACTEYADHHVRARSDENRKASALWGPGDALKNKAFELVTA
jgi:hypothetical protein